MKAADHAFLMVFSFPPVWQVVFVFIFVPGPGMWSNSDKKALGISGD